MKNRVKDNPLATPAQIRSLAKRDLEAALRHPSLPLDLLEKHWLSHHHILSKHPMMLLLPLENQPLWEALQVAKGLADMQVDVQRLYIRVISAPEQLRMMRRVVAFIAMVASHARRVSLGGGFFSGAGLDDREGIKGLLRAAIKPLINSPLEARNVILLSAKKFFTPENFGLGGTKTKGTSLAAHFKRGAPVNHAELLVFIRGMIAMYEEFIDGKVAWLERAIDKYALPQEELPPLLSLSSSSEMILHPNP